jgi:hypothetical protein
VATANPFNTAVSYPPLGDRWANAARLAIGPGVADGEVRGVQYVENVTGGRFAPGDVVQASARFQLTGGTYVTSGLSSYLPHPLLRVWPRKTDGSFGTAYYGISAASAEGTQVPAGLPADTDLHLLTPKLTLPANTDRLYIAVGWQHLAAGTVNVSDLMAWKA